VVDKASVGRIDPEPEKRQLVTCSNTPSRIYSQGGESANDVLAFSDETIIS
jgi:hypothetical protein